MKTNLIKAISVAAAIVVLATGCKKNDVPTKELLLSSIEGSTIEYDNVGRIVRLGGYGSFTAFFYNGDKIAVKAVYNDYILSQIDSLYYDANGRIIKRESFSNPTTKTSTALLSYNSDGTLSSIVENVVDNNLSDYLYEYTYSGGHLVKRTAKEDFGSGYKLAEEEEFLDFDDKVNPWIDVYNKAFIDDGQSVYLSAVGKNNVTSYMSTQYIPANGQVQSTSNTIIEYTYNEQNLPVKMNMEVNGSEFVVEIGYIEK